jgi:hypothetical protein
MQRVVIGSSATHKAANLCDLFFALGERAL